MQYSTRKTGHNAVQYQENRPQCSTVPGEQTTMQYSTRRTDTMLYSTRRTDTMQYSTKRAGHNAVQHQENRPQYSTAPGEKATMQYSTSINRT